MTLVQFRALGAAILFAASLGASAAVSPRFDKLEETLKIRPEQKEQFDAAVGATQRAMVSLALTTLQMKDRVADELQKPRPDLSVFFEAQDQLIEQNRPLFKAARDEWRKLYEILDDEQVEIAKDYLRKQLGRLLQNQIAP